MNRNYASARIEGESGGRNIAGRVQFLKRRNGILVVVNITGLPRDNPTGFFGFHIHEGTDCGGKDFADTKNHLNPENRPHPEHYGDLPPLLSCKGTAYMTVLTDRFTIREIIGRTVVIHNSFDDFHSQPGGNAGMKIACGKIV